MDLDAGSDVLSGERMLLSARDEDCTSEGVAAIVCCLALVNWKSEAK